MQFNKLWLILLTRKENKRGDKCPSWGTPDGAKIELDFVPNNLIQWYLELKYELNQDKRGSPNPVSLSTLSKTPWFTKSKAFLKSLYKKSLAKSIKNEIAEYKVASGSQMARIKAMLFLNDDTVNQGWILLRTSFSKTFAIWDWTDIGL